MSGLIFIAVAVVFFAVLLRGRTLFKLSVRGGKVLLVSGRISPGLLSDFRDAISRQSVRRATIRAVREAGGAQLRISGMDDFAAQRLRNIFRLYPMSKLTAAPLDADRTLGQLLGIEWLAWLLFRG